MPQQEDFKIFRGAVEEIHVGLNWLITEREPNDSFDKTRDSLPENAAVEDYSLKLRLIMASRRHGRRATSLCAGKRRELPARSFVEEQKDSFRRRFGFWTSAFSSRSIAIPDYKVIPAAKYLISDAAVELNFTVDLIEKKF